MCLREFFVQVKKLFFFLNFNLKKNHIDKNIKLNLSITMNFINPIWPKKSSQFRLKNLQMKHGIRRFFVGSQIIQSKWPFSVYNIAAHECKFTVTAALVIINFTIGCAFCAHKLGCVLQTLLKQIMDTSMRAYRTDN